VKRFAIAALLIAVAGCSSSGSMPGPTGPDPSLLANAHLQPCPTSSASSVPGGLPNLTLDCLGDGPAVHLAGLTGTPTVVNFWGSWCGPCQEEASILSSASHRLSARVRFIGIDVEDSDNSALDFDAHVSPPVNYPSVVDPDKKALLAMHFTGPPETLLVDSAGKIVHIHRGKYDTSAQLRNDIGKFLHVRFPDE